MTVNEFNYKWKNHLEEGLEFNDAEGKVVNWLDKHFVLFELTNPEFTYAQIAEDAINEIMKCEL